MSINSKAYIVGAFEHPTRLAKDKSVARLHAEVAQGAILDAGLTRDDIDGYFCAGDAPGMGPTSMVEHLNIKARYLDSTDLGGASYLSLVSHAAQAIAMGKCNVALITLAGRPRSEGMATGTTPRVREPSQPDYAFDVIGAVFRQTEHDDIATRGSGRMAIAIGIFRDKEIITNDECRDH